jgi:C4-dicarboxylate transporter
MMNKLRHRVYKCNDAPFLLVVVLLFFVQQYSDQKTKNYNTVTKKQRKTIQRPKDKEQQYSDQKTKSNNTTTKRQRTTIQRLKEKEQQ